MPLAKVLKAVGLGGAALLVVVVVVLVVSTAWWGFILGFVLWNHVLVHVLHDAGSLSFWGCAGVGFVASLVLG